MVKSLDLAQINDLADSGAYGGGRILSPTSAATILSAGVWLSDLQNWQGAGYDLTEDEIDEIEALVAELEYEVMTEEGSEVADYVKIAESIYTSDVAEPYVDNFDSGDWKLFKIYLQGLRTDSSVSWVDHIEVEWNDDTDDETYYSYGRFNYYGTAQQYENIANYPANLFYYAAPTSLSSSGVQALVEYTVYSPQVEGYKGAEYRAVNPGYVTQRLTHVRGVNSILITDDLEKILLRSNAGTTFVVGGVGEPDELRMSVYGLK